MDGESEGSGERVDGVSFGGELEVGGLPLGTLGG